MRVLIVDDHALVRSGIASLLRENDIEVVGEAASGLEAVEKAVSLKPDIVLMDIKMPGCNGLQATKLIKAEMHQAKIVMLTAFDDDENLFEAIKNGAASIRGGAISINYIRAIIDNWITNGYKTKKRKQDKQADNIPSIDDVLATQEAKR